MSMPESPTIESELEDQLNKEQLHAMALEGELEEMRGKVRAAEEGVRQVKWTLEKTRNTLRLHKQSENEVRCKLATALGLEQSAAWVEVTEAVEARTSPRETSHYHGRLTELLDELGAFFGGMEDDRKLMSDQHDSDVQLIRAQAQAIQKHLEEAVELRHEINDLKEKIVDLLKQRDTLLNDRDALLNDRDGRAKTIQSLRNQLFVFQAGEAHTAARWKSHYADLAAAIGVPRIYYGNQQDPQVDAVMCYVARIMPTIELGSRVQALEARLEAQQQSEPATTIPADPPPSSEEGVLCGCGHLYPVSAAFCPLCGRDTPKGPE